MPRIFMKERMNGLVQIESERELKALREAFPKLHIVRTVHKWYVEEEAAVVDFLRKFRNAKQVIAGA